MLHPETSSVLRYIPDTIQTPPDTTQTPPAKGVLCNIGHWKKRPYLIFITFYNILRDLAFIHLRHPETPSRHPQTTSRHPQTFLCNKGHYTYYIGQVPCITYKRFCLEVSGLCLRVSGWCLDGVWMGSGWGLRVSGDVLIPNLMANKLY